MRWAIFSLLVASCGQLSVDNAMPQLAASLESVKAVYKQFCDQHAAEAVCVEAKTKINTAVDAYNSVNDKIEE